VDKAMLEIKVTTSTDGKINIHQCWDDPDCHQMIEVMPAQLDILMKWLEEARRELEAG
jgi:hypothetical protein